MSGNILINLKIERATLFVFDRDSGVFLISTCKCKGEWIINHYKIVIWIYSNLDMCNTGIYYAIIVCYQ